MLQQILRFLRQMESRQLYFWMGFLAGGLFWWIASRLRVLLPQARTSLRKQIAEARQSLTTSTEARLRRDILRMAQHMHLADSLFALDEIAIPPRLMAPPPPPQGDEEEPDLNAPNVLLPHLPDWPELAATYRAPTLTLPEALSGGTNLILIGAPGSGKTVALAYLASQISRRAAEVGDLVNFLPLLVHAADLRLGSEPPKEPLEPLISAVSQNVSALTLPRLPVILRSAFERNSVLLLLDGMDELPPLDISQITAYLGTVLKKYPGTRVVAAAAPEYFDGLTALEMIPMPMAAWHDLDRANFIRNWGDLWQRYIAKDLPELSGKIDPLLLNGWLLSPDASITPLELTLKTWAAYVGDIQGPDAPDSIESYLLRITAGIPKARPLLEKLATQMVASLCPVLNTREIQKWTSEAAPSVSPFDESAPPFDEEAFTAETSPEAGEEAAASPRQSSAPDKPASAGSASQPRAQKVSGPATAQQVLPRLLESGVLIGRQAGRVSFVHPVIAGYLAGTALASSGDIEKFNQQDEWTGKALAMRYLSHWNDLTEIALPMLEEKSDPLFRKLVTACRWLRDTSKSARWRGLSMRHLAGILHKEMLPMGLRARALTALIYSGDPGVSVLLRSLLVNHMESVRRLAALGCGLARDTKSVKDLISLLNDPAHNVKMAAMLALAAIGNRDALDAIATELLHGTEEMRRAAAEVLANHPEEGHPALSDGSSMPDILVRRAVVYGLVRVNQPWAIHILEKMQIEDEQWVVRNAATQALEELKKPNLSIPRPLTPPHQLPWLIAYAGKQGIGVTPGKPAMELVISALRSQDRKEQLAALYLLSYRGDANIAHHLYQLLYGGETNLQDAAYNALSLMAASGVQLPSPTQFGFIL
jgi:HEAT repeat protein